MDWVDVGMNEYITDDDSDGQLMYVHTPVTDDVADESTSGAL